MDLERLKDLREEYGLKQEYVANYLHINQKSYSRYETGERNIPIDALSKLAELYNVSVDYLIGKSNERREESVKTHLDLVVQNQKYKEILVEILASLKLLDDNFSTINYKAFSNVLCSSIAEILSDTTSTKEFIQIVEKDSPSEEMLDKIAEKVISLKQNINKGKSL